MNWGHTARHSDLRQYVGSIAQYVGSIALALACGQSAVAGMPSITLADVHRVLSPSEMTMMRLEVISAFLLGFLAFSTAVRLIWNALRKDFPFLPSLSYPKAVGLLVLWGLLFILVLTMVSGARELMTPGAWEKDGITYKLALPGPTPIERRITERYEAIGRLRDALGEFAGRHDGRYPDPGHTTVIPESRWTMPGSGGRCYLYRGGRVPAEDSPGTGRILAYESDAFGPDRLVILENGEVVWMPIDEIEKRAKEDP